MEVVEKDASWSVHHAGIIVQANFVRALDQLRLVGCDGNYSAVRKVLWPDTAPT